MKKLLKALLIPLLVVVMAAGVLVGFLTGAEYKPAAVETLALRGEGAGALDGSGLNILSWNIGYAGLGAASDFFMDGGKSARAADRAAVDRYLGNIADTVKNGGYDLVMLQEVDVDSSRTYGVDESASLMRGTGVHALNYSCPFVPVPFPPMGKVNSGLMTTTDYEIREAERIALPCPFSWPMSTVNLKRCLLVSRLPVAGGDRELVLVNLHLEAYDDGEGKLAQTRALMEFLQEEYEKGNYVVAGGDFNQAFPGSLEAFPMVDPAYWTPGVLEEASLPEGFSFVCDLTTPSCRLLNQPYDPSDTAHTQVYLIDGFLVSPNVTVREVETLDLGCADSDHNPVRIRVSLD